MHYCTPINKTKKTNQDEAKEESSLLECQSEAFRRFVYTVRRSVRTRTIEPRPADAKTLKNKVTRWFVLSKCRSYFFMPSQ